MSGYKEPADRVGDPAAIARVRSTDDWQSVFIGPERTVSFAEHDDRIDTAGDWAIEAYDEMLSEQPYWISSYLRDIYSRIGNSISILGVGTEIISYVSTSSSSALEQCRNFLDENARHKAMLSFLDDMDLTDKYYGGTIIEPAHVRRKFKKQDQEVFEEDKKSWAVSIGYLPEERIQTGNSVFLTAEFRYGVDCKSYKYSLVGYAHSNRLSEDRLKHIGLI